MQYINFILSTQEIEKIKKTYGDYIKITADIQKGDLAVGCTLHADGEKILLEKGAEQDNIWGGGINFNLKEIDTTAVLNLRPRLDNNSMEIIDQKRREKFINVVKHCFAKLWEK